MSDGTQLTEYALIDATVGSRLLLGFSVSEEPLRLRVPHPLEPSPVSPSAYRAVLGALGASAGTSQKGPNLLLVFNDLLLNQDEHERTQADASARYVGFNIPSRNRITEQEGMVHFRIFTGNPKAVPGRYRDALPAGVRRDIRSVGVGVSTTVEDHWELEPEAGGLIGLHLVYERGPLVRIVGQEPNFLVWAAADTGICRVYQEDMLFEVIRLDSANIDRVRQFSFRITIPELSDIFTGDERLVSIFGNPHYSRRVFSNGR